MLARERVRNVRALKSRNTNNSDPEMPITLSMHRRLGFHVVRFESVITFTELVELGRLHEAFPVFAAADAIHIIDEAADLSRLQLSELDLLRAHYATLQSGLDLYMLRRSAWVCSTAATCKLVEYWLDGRHSRDGQKTEVVMAAKVEDVFPLFSHDEIEEVQAGREFTEISRFGAGGTGRVVW